jgi:CheY-like chemotaxis protein
MPSRVSKPPKPPPLPRASKRMKAVKAPEKVEKDERRSPRAAPKRSVEPPEMPPLPLVGGYAADVPRGPEAPAPAPTPVSTHEAKGAHSILVVEDDEATRRLMVRALRTEYTVFEASNGEEAVNLLDVHPKIDCVVSDIMMPKLSGTELAQRMRTDSRLARVPVVFVTAKNGAGEGIEAINLGVRHYLRKPFKLRDLLEKIGAVIKKPH